MRAWLKKQERKFNTSPGVNSLSAMLAVLPAFVAIIIFGLLPAILNVGLSFTNYRGPGFEWKVVWFENYVSFFTLEGGKTIQSLGRTIVFSFFVVFLQQPISLLIAILVNQGKKATNFFRAIYFMPSILGITAISYIWVLILDPISGPVAYLLANFGTSSALLGDPKLAMMLVILITVWANFGFSMTIYLAGLQSIPRELYEAAEIDGVNKWQKFKYITIPLIRPALTINFWISISGTLGMFDIIFLLTGGGPGEATMTFSLYFFKRVTTTSINQGQTAAMSIYFFIFVTAIMLTFNYFFRRKEIEL